MNAQEQMFFDAMTKRGFEVLRRGWPDFLVLSKDWKRGFAVEYKSQTDRLRPEQERMHAALARFGIQTYIAKPEFQSFLRKRGHALVVPEDYHALRQKYEELEFELRLMRRQMELHKASLESLPVLLEPPTDAQDECRDVGMLIDAETQDVSEARQRQETRILHRELEKYAPLSGNGKA